MKVIYVAGKFSGPNAWEVEKNIRRAEEVSLELWSAGFAVICPHTNTRFFDGALPIKTFLAGDLEILNRCDAIFMLSNWRDSAGACGERLHAAAKGLVVCYSMRDAIHYLEEINE